MDSIVYKASAEIERLRLRGNDCARFPPACKTLLRRLPGNLLCVDCGAANPEWASLSYGCLLCMHCSGRHRSYGVATSIVRSIHMDDWTSAQVLAMLEGGNQQLTAFFDRHQMGRPTTATASSSLSCLPVSGMVRKRYRTKAALFYRTHLSNHVAVLVKQGTYQGREASRRHYQKSSQHAAEEEGRPRSVPA